MASAEDLRDRSLRFIEEENLTYQAVPLPGGVVTPGHERKYLLEVLFGDDFAGQSYLDIGSYSGYFCIEALRRGAARATGIETDIENVRKAAKIAELWSLSPEYIHGDFENWDPGDRAYDVVTCMNVLHHLYDPIHAIFKMMRLVRSRIVLEVAVPRWRDVRPNVGSLLASREPALLLSKPKKKYGNVGGRTYLFTPQALRTIFNMHTTMFDPIDIVRSPFKGRVVVVARKRQIGHLVVVCGPTSVGKSTLSERLADDAGLRRQFDMEDAEWPILQAADAYQMAPRRHDHAILHYDMLRPWHSGLRSHDRDPALHLLNVADRVTILTVVAPRRQLLEQLRAAMAQAGNRKPSRKHKKLEELYGSDQFLLDWYTAWNMFRARYPSARSMLVDSSNEYSRMDGRAWSDVLDA